jgi:hypothetical protein
MEKKWKNLREFWGEDGVKRVLDLVKSKEKELKEKELELNESGDNTKRVKKIRF